MTDRLVAFVEAFVAHLDDRGASVRSVAGFRSLLDKHIRVEPPGDELAALQELGVFVDSWRRDHPSATITSAEQAEQDLRAFTDEFLTHARALEASADARGSSLFGTTLEQDEAEELVRAMEHLRSVLRSRRRPSLPLGPTVQERKTAARLLAMAETERPEREAEARTVRVKEALAWWRTEGRHYDDPRWFSAYVAHHRDSILAREAEIRKRFDALDDPCSTREKCFELAGWALGNIPREVAYDFETAPDAAILANILRRHFGHEREELLPAARSPQSPAPPSDVDKLLRDVEGLLAELPAADREALTREYQAAVLRENYVDIDAKIVAAHRRQREARGDSREQIEESVTRLATNLRAVQDRHALKKHKFA